MHTPQDILYIIPRPEIGGAERQLLMLMQGLDRTRFRPHVICLDGTGSLIDEYRDTAETCIVLNRQKAFDRHTLRALIGYIRTIRPTCVHTWLYIANLYGSIAARIAKVPHVIVSQRGLGIDPQHSKFKVWQMKAFNFLISKLSDHLLVNAQAVAKPMYQVGFKPNTTQIVYNGLDLNTTVSIAEQEALKQELGIYPNDLLLGTVARIDPKKDLATMLRAFAIVSKKCAQARLLIIGGGFPHYQRQLEALAQALNVDHRVDFLGFRNDPQAVLSLCDISLLSSITEGLPNAILESMALGKPVVATAVGGVTELIDHETHGQLVMPGDYRAFANAVINLIDNPDLGIQMGTAGKHKAQRQFSRQAMIQNTENIYAQLFGTLPTLNTPSHRELAPIS